MIPFQGKPHFQLPSPIEEIQHDVLSSRGVRLFLKRDDLINPEIPGNKYRKLKYNIAEAKKAGHTRLLTFGGAYSNHIRAVAAAGHYYGFSTIGVIRGEEYRPLNESLAYAVEQGMKLVYMDRKTYRQKNSEPVISLLHEKYGEFYLLPEGGTNKHAVKGCQEIVSEINLEFDFICCACGTGGTLAGITSGLNNKQYAIGFSALKGGQFLADDVASLHLATFGSPLPNWHIEYDYHFGGFARTRPELNDFISRFHSQYGLLLERVYVAKMMYGIFELVQQGKFPFGSKIIALITG